MQTQIQSKGFELHDAQKYLINKSTSNVERYLNQLSYTQPNINVVASCHRSPRPIFTVHVYLELSSDKISAIATSRRFAQALNESMDHLKRQIRKRKTDLLKQRESDKIITSTA